MLPLIIMAAIGAAGAVAGAVTTYAANEKDRQAVKRYEKVNAELISSRDKLQKRYYQLSDRSKKQINDLNLKLAQSEMEKDLVYLALDLYQELMALREDIDINPSFEVLVEFHKAIVLTNYVLQQLDKRLVPISQDYFSRTLNRIDERDNLSKQQLFSFMAVLMNPQQDTVMSLLDEVQNQITLEADESIKVNVHNDEEIYNVTAEEWINRGLDFNEQQQYKRAVVCFDEAIKINRQNSLGWYYKGLALWNLEKNSAALQAINQSIDIDANNDQFWFLSGLVLWDFDKYDKALRAFTQAIELNPKIADYWYYKSQTLWILGRDSEAMQSLNKAINLEPYNNEYKNLRDQIESNSVVSSRLG